MIPAAAGCAAAAVIATLFAPGVLRLRGWSVRFPALALWTWLGLFGLSLTLAATSVVLVVATSVLGGLGQGTAGTAAFVGAWFVLGATGAFLALVVTRSSTVLAGVERGSLATGLLCSRFGRRVGEDRGVAVTVIPSDDLHAFSLRSAGGWQVVLTEVLVAALTPAQLAAVIAHERAHLSGRHQWLVQLGALNRACFPSLPSACGLDRSIRVLTELVADDAAARRCGRASLGGALHRMADLTGDAAVRARAVRVTNAGGAVPVG